MMDKSTTFIESLFIVTCFSVIGFVVISFMGILPEHNVFAQANPTDRFFTKDYCVAEKSLFDDVSYNSPNDFLSYDITACPNSQVIIHRWNELTVGEQTLIIARLTALGYEDITEQVNQILN